MIRVGLFEKCILFLLLIILPLTYAFSFAEYILLFAIVFISLPALVVFFKRDRTKTKLSRENRRIFVAFAIYIVWMGLMLINSSLSIDSIVRLVQIWGCLFAFTCGSMICWNSKAFKTVYFIIKCVMLGNFAAWLICGIPMQNFSFFIENTATYASLIYCWLIFLSLRENKSVSDKVVILIGILLAFVSSTRATLIALLVFYAVIVYVKSVRGKKEVGRKKINCLLFCEITFCVLFIIVYSKMNYTELGIKLNEFSRAYFGKNFFSGRQIIWHNLIEAIKKHPIIGYGLDALPSDIYATHLSAHNTFLQVALQTGVVGLVLLLNILVKIFKKLARKVDSWSSVIGVACIASIIVHECFEACLVQNMLVAGVQMWFVLGVASNEAMLIEKGDWTDE